MLRTNRREGVKAPIPTRYFLKHRSRRSWASGGNVSYFTSPSLRSKQCLSQSVSKPHMSADTQYGRRTIRHDNPIQHMSLGATKPQTTQISSDTDRNCVSACQACTTFGSHTREPVTNGPRLPDQTETKVHIPPRLLCVSWSDLSSWTESEMDAHNAGGHVAVVPVAAANQTPVAKPQPASCLLAW